MCKGCICNYTAFDLNKFVCCSNGVCECLCIRQSSCCAVGATPRGIGIVTEPEKGEICKIGLFCCDYAIIYPKNLCASAGEMWCCYSVQSFPFDKEYLLEPVCALYFLQCLPECKCCGPPPDCPILGRVSNAAGLPPHSEVMDRDSVVLEDTGIDLAKLEPAEIRTAEEMSSML